MPNDSPPSAPSTRLHLFVVGTEPHSARARENLERAIAESGINYEVTVTDVLKDYREALEHGVLIAPTLIITAGELRITVAGDLSDTAKLKAALTMI